MWFDLAEPAVGQLLPLQREVGDRGPLDAYLDGPGVVLVLGLGGDLAPGGQDAVPAVRGEGAVQADDPADNRTVLVHDVQGEPPVLHVGPVPPAQMGGDVQDGGAAWRVAAPLLGYGPGPHGDPLGPEPAPLPGEPGTHREEDDAHGRDQEDREDA